MWRFSVREQTKGFTLLELIVVIGLIGVLSAISAPVFGGMYARTRVNHGLTGVQTALLEGQRQAIRTSRSCDLTLTTQPPTLSGTCLPGGRRQLTRVAVRSSASTLRFNFKGVLLNPDQTVRTQPVTVVVTSPQTNLQRCLVISAPLGLMRTGTYNGTGTVEANCVP